MCIRDSAKSEAWARIHAEGYGSLHRTRAAMAGFNHAHQATLLAPYVDAFFAAVRGVVAGHENAFSNTYVARLFPAYRVEPEMVASVRARATISGSTR